MHIYSSTTQKNSQVLLLSFRCMFQFTKCVALSGMNWIKKVQKMLKCQPWWNALC